MSLIKDVGAGKGRNYAVNVPLRDGITDEAYQSIFKPVSPFLFICLFIYSTRCRVTIQINVKGEKWDGTREKKTVLRVSTL